MGNRLARLWCALFLITSVADGQLPPRLEECLPIPSYGSELRAYAGSFPRPITPNVRVVEIAVETSALSPAAIRKTRTEIMQQRYSADAEWKTDIGERIKHALNRNGYFYPEVEIQEVGSGAAGSKKVRKVRIRGLVKPGHQYRLQEIQFRGQTAFAAEELRPLFSIGTGAIFDTDKIRQGLENLRKIYGTKGYINFVPIPDTFVDEEKHTIKLTIKMDEGPVYHVGGIRALGLDDELVKRVAEKSDLLPGAVYSGEKLKGMFRSLEKAIPTDQIRESDSETIRDDRNHTVTLILDFRRCPDEKPVKR
jgi:outer membrane translocation and assembly module TamA